MSQLAGTRVLLTGASRGIGRATAAALAAEGADLVLVARGAQALEAVAREVGAHSVAGDVSDDRFVSDCIAHVRARWGDVPDVLINNAGVFALALFGETPVEAFDRHLAVNLRGPFLLIRACLPGMLRRGSGHIVNVGSVAARRGPPGNAAYSASKFGLRGLHEVLAAEIAGTGVRCTWIEPSAVDTRVWDALDPPRGIALPRREEMLRAEEVAQAIVHALTGPAGMVEIRLRGRCTSG